MAAQDTRHTSSPGNPWSDSADRTTGGTGLELGFQEERIRGLSRFNEGPYLRRGTRSRRNPDCLRKVFQLVGFHRACEVSTVTRSPNHKRGREATLPPRRSDLPTRACAATWPGAARRGPFYSSRPGGVPASLTKLRANASNLTGNHGSPVMTMDACPPRGHQTHGNAVRGRAAEVLASSQAPKCRLLPPPTSSFNYRAAITARPETEGCVTAGFRVRCPDLNLDPPRAGVQGSVGVSTAGDQANHLLRPSRIVSQAQNSSALSTPRIERVKRKVQASAVLRHTRAVCTISPILRGKNFGGPGSFPNAAAPQSSRI